MEAKIAQEAANHASTDAEACTKTVGDSVKKVDMDNLQFAKDNAYNAQVVAEEAAKCANLVAQSTIPSKTKFLTFKKNMKENQKYHIQLKLIRRRQHSTTVQASWK